MLSPIPLQEFEPCSSAARPRRSFPPRSFSSPEFFDFEFEAIWNHEWFCVGRTTDVLNPGDYYTVTVGAEPLIVVRGEDGVVRVLSAVCQHRGMIVVAGRGRPAVFAARSTLGSTGSMARCAPPLTGTVKTEASTWPRFVFPRFGPRPGPDSSS